MNKPPDTSGESSANGNGKSQVWVRLRPTALYEDSYSFMSVGADGKTINLRVGPDDRLKRSSPAAAAAGANSARAKPNTASFSSDGILQNPSQEEMYTAVVKPIVFSAMNGTNSGVVICLGPEKCGKSFTLFGKTDKFNYRGVISRALEDMMRIAEERREEDAYTFRIGIAEVHKNRIRDLLTVDGLADPGSSHQSYHHEQFYSVQNALTSLMLALATQKAIKREPFVKCHTLVQIVITGQPKLPDNRAGFQTRITFAKIAAIPMGNTQLDELDWLSARPAYEEAGLYPMSARYASLSRKACSVSPRRSASSSVQYLQSQKTPPAKPTPASEATEVRKDLFTLEQMFARASEDLKLKSCDGSGCVSARGKPKVSLSQYFRTSKLAYCLQDMLATGSDVRIVLNIRPERQYLQRTIDAMKFARKAETLGQELLFAQNQQEPVPSHFSPEAIRKELIAVHRELELMKSTLNEPNESQSHSQQRPLQLSDLYRNTKPGDIGGMGSPNRDAILEVAAFLDGKIDEIGLGGKVKHKTVLEIIRQIWRFTSDQHWENLDARPSVHQNTQFPDSDEQQVGSGRKKKTPARAASRVKSATTSARTETSDRERTKRVKGPKADVSLNVTEKGPQAQAEENSNAAGPDEGAGAGRNMAHIVPRSALNDPIEAWKEFIHTFRGEMIIKQINRQNSAHAQCVEEVNGILEPVCNVVTECLHKISSLLLRDAEPVNERPQSEQGDGGAITVTGAMAAGPGTQDGQSGPMGELGVLDANCDEFFQRMLELCRGALEQHEQIIKLSKAECEKLFLQFNQGTSVGNVDALIGNNTPGAGAAPASVRDQIPLTNLPQCTGSNGQLQQPPPATGQCPPMTTYFQRNDYMSNYDPRQIEPEHYEEINRNAKRIAKQLVKCYNPRPQWVSAFTKGS